MCTLEGSILTDFCFEITSQNSTYGDIYLGKVINVLHGLSAYFIDYGGNRNGFLPAISTLIPLKKGDLVIVQICKTEKDLKGARLSCFVKIIGEYYTYMPYGSSISTKYIPSRKLKGRHGESASSELKELDDEWRSILERVKNLKEPALLKKGASQIYQLLRDDYHSKKIHIIIDGDSTSLKETVRDLNLNHTVEEYTGLLPVFAKYGVAKSVRTLTDRVVYLPSGGSIAIDVAEAMTCIDVNSGSYVNSNLETTSYEVNLEAVDEIGRQIKIRDISGIIAIDFIDMKKPSYIENIQNKMQDILRFDNVLSKISKINEFGVMMISRQRSVQSVNDLMTDKCKNCNNGRFKNKYKTAFDIFSEIRLSAYTNPNSNITVECHPDVANYILNYMKRRLIDIEERTGQVQINWSETVDGYTVEPKGILPKLQVDPVKHMYKYDKLPMVIYPQVYTAVNLDRHIYIVGINER
jgi:ribonuclease E